MTKRVGLLIPSSNTVMEIDFHRRLPDSVTVHTGRMYLESTTVEGEEVMLDEYALPAAKMLATAKPSVVVFGCTSAGALRGNSYDIELCQRISNIVEAPVISVIESVRGELKASGGKSIAVLTPYIDELTQRVVSSVEADGLKVTKAYGMNISHNFDIGLVEPEQIVEYAREQLGNTLPADVLFVSCTNYRAVAAIPMLRELYDTPVITSNQAALNAVERALLSLG